MGCSSMRGSSPMISLTAAATTLFWHRPLHLVVKHTRNSAESATTARKELKMKTIPAHSIRRGLDRRSFTAGIGVVGLIAGSSPLRRAHAQGAALKVGVLLPRSGAQAGIGQD